MLLDFFNNYRSDAQHIASVLLALAIWRWGAGPERWLISIFIAAMVMPVYAYWLLDLGDAAIGPYAGAYVLIDLLACAAFVAVALNANRNYPLWIAGFQLVVMVAHLVRSVVDSVSPLAFAILMIGPSYVQLLLLTGGFLRHRQREHRFGPYREWRLAAPGLRRLGQ